MEKKKIAASFCVACAVLSLAPWGSAQTIHDCGLNQSRYELRQYDIESEPYAPRWAQPRKPQAGTARVVVSDRDFLPLI